MTQPTALFLADILEDAGKPADIADKCASELRRLHEQIAASTECGLAEVKALCAALDRLTDAALAEPCPCGDRPAVQCPGEWEPGCDLGNNPKYAKRVEMTPKPLTEEEIRDLWSWAMTAEAERTATTQQHAFARAI